MAEPELSTFFPVPPPFYKAFTKANQDQLQQLQTATSEEASNQEGISQRLLELPPEVRLLIPPKPPSDGIHQSFGAELGVSQGEHNIMQPLVCSLLTQRHDRAPRRPSRN